MNAETLREISKETTECKRISISSDSSKSFDQVFDCMRNSATDGKRQCQIKMSAIHYSVIPRLLALGFDIRDSSDRGLFWVSW